MSEMKPCPFCGADNGYVDVIPNPFSNDIYSRGHCIKCHAVGTFYMQSYLEGELRPSFEQMAQMATEQWNTRPIEDALNKRIAELEGFIDRLIEVGDWLNAMHEDGVFVDELNAARTSWKLAVSDWQAMPSHVTNPLDSQGIVTRNGGEG